MRVLQWWMRGVGVFYLFYAGVLLPFGTGPGKAPASVTFDQQYPQRMEDWQFFFGLQVGLLGAALMYASQRPRENIILVWLVVLQEAIRGVVGMLYYLGRGAPLSLYGPLALMHLFVVGSGIDFARRAMREPV